MVSLKKYLEGTSVNPSTKLNEGDEVIISECMKYIVTHVPKYGGYVLLKAGGDGVSGMGLVKGYISFGEVQRFYSSCTVRLLGAVEIKPGFMLRGRATGSKYSVGFFCGKWKMVNCDTGTEIGSLNVNRCTLTGDELKQMVRDVDLYDVIEV